MAGNLKFRSPQDHPRIRGEHNGTSSSSCRACGSSPHTRGARAASRRRHRPRRIIPAYAGSTVPMALMATALADHPRIRGEHLPLAVWRALDDGSSPHTRGALAGFDADGGPERIIPAYAGSTCRARWRIGRRWDHPRIRGEHLNRIKNEMPSEGSSPHTRGAPGFVVKLTIAGRIIPAYAGSTRPCRSPRARPADHPRIRGEHASRRENATRHAGSSPHTRGAHFYHIPSVSPPRIIPAYAESTKIAQKGKGMAADHPRIRGEHTEYWCLGYAKYGSSPHTRGARNSSRP